MSNECWVYLPSKFCVGLWSTKSILEIVQPPKLEKLEKETKNIETWNTVCHRMLLHITFRKYKIYRILYNIKVKMYCEQLHIKGEYSFWPTQLCLTAKGLVSKDMTKNPGVLASTLLWVGQGGRGGLLPQEHAVRSWRNMGTEASSYRLPPPPFLSCVGVLGGRAVLWETLFQTLSTQSYPLWSSLERTVPFTLSWVTATDMFN